MRIGFTLLKESADSALSPHFGKAKWLGIHDTDTNTTHFVRNTGLSGRFVADVFGEANCTHAVFAQIGAPALEHLKAHGLEAFWGEAEVPATTLVQRLKRGQLARAETSEHTPKRAHRHHAASN